MFERLIPVGVCWVLALGCSAGSGAGGGGPSGPLPERYALQFDGVDDYASSGTAGFPLSKKPQSFSLWVNATAVTSTQTFIALRRFLGNGLHFGLRAGKLAAWRTSDEAVLVEGPALPEASWHHVAYVFDGIQNVLFLDGVQVATNATTAMDAPIPIGAWLGTFEGTQQMFKGQLNQVRVWTVARTAAELGAEMTGGVPATTAGLAASWGFDEDGGASAFDYSGHGNTAILGDGVPEHMPVRVADTTPVTGPRG